MVSRELPTNSAAPSEAERCTVVVIGAGLGGLAVAVNLIKRGITDFVLLEQSRGVGGTWWDNRYPGAEVDVTSELYSYSFKSNVFTRSHASQAELLSYIDEVVDEYGIAPMLRLSARVTDATWDESASLYEVVAQDGRRWRARYLVSAVGQLNNPNYPQWPGMDEFEGPCFHTARWDADVGPAGKTVAVVGWGSRSAQVIPPLAEVAGQVYLYQRQPGWVLPKLDYDYSDV